MFATGTFSLIFSTGERAERKPLYRLPGTFMRCSITETIALAHPRRYLIRRGRCVLIRFHPIAPGLKSEPIAAADVYWSFTIFRVKRAWAQIAWCDRQISFIPTKFRQSIHATPSTPFWLR